MRLYTWPKVGLPDEVAMPDAAGGEGGHDGAAKPDRVIHRYISNHILPILPVPYMYQRLICSRELRAARLTRQNRTGNEAKFPYPPP